MHAPGTTGRGPEPMMHASGTTGRGPEPTMHASGTTGWGPEPTMHASGTTGRGSEPTMHASGTTGRGPLTTELVCQPLPGCVMPGYWLGKYRSPTRTRVMPVAPLALATRFLVTLNNSKNNWVAAMVLLSHWFVCKQSLFM